MSSAKEGYTRQEKRRLTSIQILLHRALNSTLVHLRHTLTFKWLPILASLEHAYITRRQPNTPSSPQRRQPTVRVHSPLQSIVFPAKQVIRMRAIPLVVVIGKEEGVRPISRPHVIELCWLDSYYVIH
jgi:hypothetical protein